MPSSAAATKCVAPRLRVKFCRRDRSNHKGLKPEDLLATFTEFTAATISKSIADHVPNLEDISLLIASGGVVKNSFLMGRLAQLLPKSLRLTTSDEFGIPPQYKEAIKFATLAYATVSQLANNIPAASGASGFTLLGKVVFPPRLAKTSSIT